MEGMLLKVDTLVNGYVDVVNYVMDHGHEAGPRDLATREVLGATIVVEDPTRCLPLGVGRRVSKKVAAIETLQLIGGFTDPRLVLAASDAFEKVQDGGAFHGAYGPRAAPQFQRVLDRLRDDPQSRRAIITIWDPAMDLYRDGLHDYPCTVSLEYTIRNNRLIAQTHMRSNDVWLGLAYDAFVFTQVQLTLATMLGVEAGPYIHHASSLHIYESDVDAAEQLVKPRIPHLEVDILPKGLASPNEWADHRCWDVPQACAQAIAYGGSAPAGMKWYQDVMKEIHASIMG